jgi:hypothetical protein
VNNVVKVFRDTGTLWENYAPERAEHGDYSCRKDFVGWTGLSPIAILFEYVFGIRPDVPKNQLVWDIKLLDAHGIENYPFGRKGIVHLHCAARKSIKEKPVINVKSNMPLNLTVKWKGGMEMIRL